MKQKTLETLETLEKIVTTKELNVIAEEVRTLEEEEVEEEEEEVIEIETLTLSRAGKTMNPTNTMVTEVGSH